MSDSGKQPRNESSISYLITLTVNVRGVQIKAFVDLGSDNNYISGEAALRAGLQPRLKRTPYLLQVANGQRMPRESIIKHEVSTKLYI
jgi:predicted aspartyl protease